jgi:hypothetical protein
MKVLFLDIDGVLNGHKPKDNGWYGIDYDKVCLLNKFLRACSDVQIVLSSAWRYMILKEAMTIKGFEHLLVSHGVACVDRLIDHTGQDTKMGYDRHIQIREWVENHLPDKWVALDDLDLSLPEEHFVHVTDGKGITMEHVLSLIKKFQD